MAKNRGGDHNKDYEDGYAYERDKFDKYKSHLIKFLQADKLELTTRGLLDKATGTDAVAQIDGKVYGISLRFRESDYNSFTLTRHINDRFSEVHKWRMERSENMKPAWHFQIAERGNNEFRVIRINIDAFGLYLDYLINNNQLEKHYQPHLRAYEFNLKDIDERFMGVFKSKVLKVLTQ